jgi:hypothetical protein
MFAAATSFISMCRSHPEYLVRGDKLENYAPGTLATTLGINEAKPANAPKLNVG